jgi:Zn-dependent peptidase ImmA (M78 family)
MMDDYKAPPRSTKDIEALTIAWRDALGINDQWAPDMVRLLENDLPKYVPQFALIVRADREMEDAEAYTEFNPPHIAVRSSVYHLASKFDGRGRMTFAHELGHLVMHVSDGPRPRAVDQLKTPSGIRLYESAEWQARKFASLFLLPEHIARQFSSIRALSEGCKVSYQAAEIRFTELGLNKRPEAPCIRDLASALEGQKSQRSKPRIVT